MGCPIPLGSRFIRFAFRLATLWIAPFHKVVASLHLSTPRSPRRLKGMTLAWRPIPQPRQTGSLEGGCYRAGEVLRKSTWGNYGKRVSRTTQKTAHRAPYLPLWNKPWANGLLWAGYMGLAATTWMLKYP